MRFRFALPASLLAITLLAAPTAGATAQDCSTNSIIRCGVQTKNDLLAKMQNGDGTNSAANIQAAYNSQKITMEQIRSTNIKNGSVRKDGTVWVGGKKVATGAKSMGRDFMEGSTKHGLFWMRPTSVSFQQDSLPAYVYMKNGRFEWAIIKPCGNPVAAQPVIAKTQPAPVVQKIVVEKPVVIEKRVVEQQIIEKPLPQTGSENNTATGLFGILGISGALGFLIRSQDRVRQLLTNV